MIINLRGTSGSGKSTIVRAVMELYASKEIWRSAEMLTDRKRPLGYLLARPHGRPLFVPGHYETACGGCDTIAEHQFDNVYKLVREWADKDYDVLFEGLLLSAESARAIQLHRDGYKLMVIGLNTPLETCLEGIRARRLERGGEPDAEFAPSVLKNATAKEKGTRACIEKIWAAGIQTYVGSRSQAFQEIVSALDL